MPVVAGFGATATEPLARAAESSPPSFACSALRFPTARTASMWPSAITEIPAES
jgi:hypothetical protein